MTAPDPLTLVVKTAQARIRCCRTRCRPSASCPPRRTAAARSPSTGSCEGRRHLSEDRGVQRGEAAIGTGPYKLARYTKGDRIILERNDGYWGEKPAWQRGHFRPITSAGPRVAALLAGDVDLIENPPIQDFERIKQTPASRSSQGLSNRVIYLHFDQLDDPPGRRPASRARRQEPVPRQARARGDLQGDQPRRHRRAHHGRRRGAGRRAAAAVLFGANKDMKAAQGRSGRREEAARRGRLSERLRG